MQLEREVVTLLDAMSSSADEFHGLSAQVEFPDPEAAVNDGFIIPDDSPLRAYLTDDQSVTEGLDLGVAGVVYALAAVGCHPMASCKGPPHDWAPHPLVRFTARMWRARALLPLALEAQCGLEEVGGTLGTWASSIVKLMDFAQLIVDHRKEFVRNPVAPLRQRPPKHPGSSQPSLFA